MKASQSLKFVLFIAFLLCASSAFGQFDTAEVLGTIRDSTGGTLPNTAVTLTNQDTGIEMKTTSDANGNYDFFNVKVGRYKITAELPGFSRFEASDVVVNVN